MGNTAGSESVKGTLLLGAVVGARRIRDRLGLGPDALGARLSSEALELLDQKIEVARWYPVRAFCELVDWGWDIEGGRDPAYLEKQGAVSAERLFESNRYQQLDYAARADRADDPDQLVRQSRRITTILGAFYDFLRVEVSVAPDSLEITYENAAAFGDPLIHTTVGFKNQINERQGSKIRWSGARIRPDAVSFLMPLPKRFTQQD